MKYALLQREDQYNFPHLKNQKIIADELRREVHRLRKQERIEKDELDKSGEGELTSGLIDKGIGFNYEKVNKSGRDLADADEDVNQIQEMTEEELKYGSEYRLDSKNYTLESREERTARLEERWIRERMAGLSSLEQHADQEGETVENHERLEKLIQRTRRVKLKVDQEALRAGAKVFFDEHNNLSEEEMLLENIPLERLENFRRLPKDHRQMILRDEMEFDRIKKIVKRKEIVEDLVDPFDMKDSKLMLQDTDEYRSVVGDKRELAKEMEAKHRSEDKGQAAADREKADIDSLESDPRIAKMRGRNAANEQKKKLISFVGRAAGTKKTKAQKNAEAKARKKK